jgi:hypothetical protein
MLASCPHHYKRIALGKYYTSPHGDMLQCMKTQFHDAKIIKKNYFSA